MPMSSRVKYSAEAACKQETGGERLNVQQPLLCVCHHTCPEALGGERAGNASVGFVLDIGTVTDHSRFVSRVASSLAKQFI